MIDVKGLKIGNNIRYGDSIIEVTGIVGNLIHHSKGFDSSIGDYNPFGGISISGNILVKCGFSRSIYDDSKFEHKNNFQVVFFKGEWIFRIVGCSICNVKYLHEIQNLCYVIDKTEIKIS